MVWQGDSLFGRLCPSNRFDPVGAGSCGSHCPGYAGQKLTREVLILLCAIFFYHTDLAVGGYMTL